MTPIPSLPTDNLYKFCAVAGCIAILASGLVAFQGWRDVLNKEREFEHVTDELKDRERQFKMDEMVSEIWWQIEPDPPATPDPKEAEKAKKEFEEKAKRIRPLLAEGQKKWEEENKRVGDAKYDFSIVCEGAGAFAFLGLLLAVYGFVNWRKIQLKQDELLDLELTKTRAECLSNR